MKCVEVTRHGDFQVATAYASGTFVSWAKMGRIQADNPVDEPGQHVWFNFGVTRVQARERILEELGLR